MLLGYVVLERQADGTLDLPCGGDVMFELDDRESAEDFLLFVGVGRGIIAEVHGDPAAA